MVLRIEKWLRFVQARAIADIAIACNLEETLAEVEGKPDVQSLKLSREVLDLGVREWNSWHTQTKALVLRDVDGTAPCPTSIGLHLRSGCSDCAGPLHDLGQGLRRCNESGSDYLGQQRVGREQHRPHQLWL